MENKIPPHPLATAPIDEDEDGAAELEAAMHRHHASELVRNHLESHVENNPGASSDYVTWIATLHPENADITIDQRFFSPGNPWWAIYEDTKNNQIPTATAVPISETGSVIGAEHASQSSGKEDNGSAVNPQPQGGTGLSNEGNQRQEPHCCKTCSPVGLAFAVLMVVPAFIGVLLCELCAFLLCYVPGTLFYLTAETLAPPNCFTCLFYHLFSVIYNTLYFCDSIVLVVSVMVSELVAMAACMVGFCTGGALWAGRLHQQIRRVCHGIRVAFRKTTATDQLPPRQFFCGGSRSRPTPNPRSDAGEEPAVSAARIDPEPQRMYSDV